MPHGAVDIANLAVSPAALRARARVVREHSRHFAGDVVGDVLRDLADELEQRAGDLERALTEPA